MITQATAEYAVVTGDALGYNVEFFEDRYKAENWADEFEGTMVTLDNANTIKEVLQDRIDRAVVAYEQSVTNHIVVD